MKTIQFYRILEVVYVLAFLTGLLASIPMIVYVYPQSKCLLFAYSLKGSLHHGGSLTCILVGYGNLITLLGALSLLILCEKEIKIIKKLHYERLLHRQIKKNIILLHLGCICLTIVLSLLITIGYGVACNNIHHPLRQGLRDQLSSDPYDTRGEEIETRFEDNNKVQRYTDRYGNAYGANYYSIRITCRSIFTDPGIHQKLHDTHTQQNAGYYGYWYQADLFAYDSQEDGSLTNMLIETSLAGSWLSILLWSLGIGVIIYKSYKAKHEKDELDRISFHSTTDNYPRGTISRNESVMSDRSTRSFKRDVDDIALSLHRPNGSMAILPSNSPLSNRKLQMNLSQMDLMSGYVYRDGMETEIF